ncbi:hypothetical protein N9L47_10115, partial [Rhodobacteraceae bacterium]|nr:hypothetical protein [Paracoccaceae bacterium]
MLRLIRPFFLTLAMTAGQASANATPNHVFQVTEKSVALLESLNAANFSTPTYGKTKVDPALPRHVLQLARDVWRKTQLLRFMNGLPTQALPPVPAREIVPADVKETVDQIYAQLEGLRPSYAITVAPEDPALPSGKSPTDVFANLLKVSAALDSLGVPTTVPNDVHQVAASVLQDALRLAEVANVTDAATAAENVPIAIGQTPVDAYFAAVAFIEDLNALATSPKGIAVTGDINIPASKDKISPSDVMIVLLRARAELNAMRFAAKDTDVSQNAGYEGGKTPSDVVTTI